MGVALTSAVAKTMRARARVPRETRTTRELPSATAIATPRERYRASERRPRRSARVWARGGERDGDDARDAR